MSKDKEKKVKLTKEEKKAKKAEKKANKTRMDANVKATIISCVSAVVCVAILLASVSNSVSKITQTNLDIASKGAGDSGDGFDDFFADFEDDGTSTGDTVAASNGGVATDGTTSGDGATATDPNGGTATATPGGTQSQAPAAKKTTAEILAIYNAATKKVETAKVPFSKDRNTTEKKYEAGMVLKGFKDIVYKFMGVGDANKFTKEVTKEDADSYFKYFKASTLSEADVSKVAIKETNGNYEIRIAVKNGSSSVKGGKVVSSGNSPLDRSGLSCGDKDKDYWDHKTAANIYSAVSEIPGCGSANIDENYSDAMIIAIVNVSTGNLVSLSAKFNFHIDLSDVMGSSGLAEATSVINMKNFKW